MEDLIFAFIAVAIAMFMTGQADAAPFNTAASDAPYVFYAGGGGSSSSSSNSRSNTPLGGTPGVELPSLVVPLIQGQRQAGYFYLTMALEVRGDDWAVREKVPFIQDALVRYVYANPIPAGTTQEEALAILSEVVVMIATDVMQNDQVRGIIYRDVSSGF